MNKNNENEMHLGVNWHLENQPALVVLHWDFLFNSSFTPVWVYWHGKYLCETSMRSRFISIAIYFFSFLCTRLLCNCKQSISLSTMLSWVREEKFFLLNGKIIKFPLPTIFPWKFDWFLCFDLQKFMLNLFNQFLFHLWLRLLLFFSQFPWWNYFSHKLPVI